VFVFGLGLGWDEATALMGVHTLGRASQENSPFDGPWSELPEQMRWNNNYYYSILGKGWIPAEAQKEGVTDRENKHYYWVRSDLGGSSKRNLHTTHQGGREMMLDTDMCLFWSITHNADRTGALADLSEVARLSAGREVQRAEDAGEANGSGPTSVCCLWAGTDDTRFPISIRNTVIPNHMDGDTHCDSISVKDDLTGNRFRDHGTMFDGCCTHPHPNVLGKTTTPGSSSRDDCTSVLWIRRGSPRSDGLPPGMAPEDVHQFAEDEEEWLKKFRLTWGKIRNKNKNFCDHNLCP